MSYAVSNVGFRIAKNQQDKLKLNLQRDLGPIVDQELAKMARQVATMAVGLAQPNNPPQGMLAIDGRISRAMAGNAGPMKIGSVTGLWAERTKAYMKWKVKRHRTRRWFKNTGKLQGELGKRARFKQAYGPVVVKFIPVKIPEPQVLSFGRSAGGQSNFITTGRLEVRPFSRLSLEAIPQIGQKASYSPALISPWVGYIEDKLKGHPSKAYRPIIEPFLAYYMRRKIPNAVFRKIEDSILT